MPYYTQDLIKDVAATYNMTERKAADFVKFIFTKVVEKTTAGDEPSFRGFGKFFIYNSKPRKCRNPKTGTPVNVPAKKRMKFKASPALKF